MRTMLPSLLLCLCFAVQNLTAGEPASQVEAQALVEQAQAALVESDTKPERIIDAALGFAAAVDAGGDAASAAAGDPFAAESTVVTSSRTL